MELYDLVWSKPLTTIAKDFFYSYSSLRQICIKNDIPLPQSGHWIKIKHNKKVIKKKLPKGENRIVLKFKKDGAIDDSFIHPNTERTIIQKELEEIKDLPLIVPEKITKSDPLIKEARTDLKGKNPHMWSRYQGLINTSKNILDIEVSKSSVSRALRFMDALIKLLKKRGHSIIVDNDTFIIVNQEKIKVKLKEFTKRVLDQENKSPWDSYNYIPSGVLSFRIDNYPEKIFKDGKTNRIENQLLNILITLELKAKKQKERRIEHEIQNKLYQEKLAKEKAYQLLKETELDNFNKLFQNATRWHKSQYIRDYINKFKEYAIKTNTLDSDKKQWIDWATEKADWYDPFIEKEVDLLDNIDRDTLKEKKKFWY